MVRHVIARCTDGRRIHYPIGEDNRIILSDRVGFRKFARRVETVEDAKNALNLIPKSSPILDVRIVDDAFEDVHKYLEEE